MTRAFEGHVNTSQLRRKGASALVLDELVRGSVDHESRTPDPSTELDRRLRGELLGVPAAKADQQGLGVRLEAPADAVLDLLRRVRLREHLRDEELDVPRPVAQPVVAVLLCPALVRVELLIEWKRGNLSLPRRERRRDEDDAADPLGMLGGEDERVAH